mgnify:CR=1 FL=1
MADAIEAEVARLKEWRQGHRAHGRSIEAAACNIGIATLRRLRERLGMSNPPYRDDFK